MNDDLKVTVINLEKDIINLTNKCSEIGEVYLFGSRGYQTHSRRSDFDLIVFPKEGVNLDQRSILLYIADAPYLDIFIGSPYSIISLSNNSFINLKSCFESIVEQLDAIKLWDSNDGFVESSKHLLIQELLDDTYFPPSELSNNKPTHSVYKFRSRYSSQLDDKRNTFLDSAIRAYNNSNPLAMIALIGSFFETTLLTLFSSYEQRVIAKGFDSNAYEQNVIQSSRRIKDGVYTRLKAFINFIDSVEHDQSFYSNYLSNEKSPFIIATFDVVRRFRNEVDHSLEFSFTMSDCNTCLILFERHLPLVYDAIALLETDPSK